MAASGTVGEDDLHALAAFRHELRRFLRASENLCKEEGITPLQYQMLLQTRAFADRNWVLVGELAERLQTSPHGVVALVSRGEAAGLVVRKSGMADRRQVQVHATALGHKLMRRIAAKHLDEIGTLNKMFRQIGAKRHA
jgi:DNA-binding MarR family transcriptional regulator